MKKQVLFITLAILMASGSALATKTIEPKTPELDKSDNCYVISSAAELFGFAALVNADREGAVPEFCGKLTDNITLNEHVLKTVDGVSNVDEVGRYIGETKNLAEWIPIGYDYKHPFLGSFHGNGYTISGLYVDNTNDYVGLFGKVGDSESLDPIVIDGVKLADTYIEGCTFVGGLVGQTVVSLSITASVVEGVVKGGFVGGFVGDARYDSGHSETEKFSLTMENDTLKASVFCVGSESYTGGLAGRVEFFTKITGALVIESIVSGNDYVGGLVGAFIEDGDVEIEETAFEGLVKASLMDCGGFIGYAQAVVVKNGTFEGDVDCESSFVGGLVGLAQRGVRLENISARGAVSGKSMVGGVVGENNNSLSIINAFVEMNVDGEAYVGGFVGREAGKSLIENSSFKGDIKATAAMAGGFAGYVTHLEIKGSSFEGNVYCQSQLVGGYAGYVNYLSVVNSYSKGNVYGEEGYAGGFVGVVQGTSRFVNSYYAGAVSIGEGASNIGGVVGLNADSEISFENVYYLENESYKAMGESALEGVSAVSVEDLENGNLAIALHKYVSADSSVDGKAWGQNVAAATPDLLPRLFENGGEIVFPVVVELNGGSLKGGDISSYVYGNGSKLPTPVREHYDFKGWFTDKDFADESLIAEIPDTAIGVLNIYADWSEHEYTIKAVSKDEAKGSVTGGGKFAYGSEVMLKAIAKSGYVFSDWTDGVATAERTIVVKGDSTFTANFEAVASSSSKNVIASSSSAKQSSSSTAKAKSSSSSAKATSSSSSVKAKSSSSSSKKKDAVVSVVQIPQFSVVASQRSLQVAGAPVGEKFAILDMQGRVAVTGRAESANFSVNVPRAGIYFVRLGNATKAVRVK